MKKANSSDITQFPLIFPSTTPSCMCSAVSLAFAYRSLFNPLVWIIFWFTLSAGSLVGFSFLGQILWKVGFLLFFLPSSHPSYRDSSILSKCTRKPVCSPCFLCSFTGALTPVYSSSWFSPDLKHLRVSRDLFSATLLVLYSPLLSQSYHHHPLNNLVFLDMVMEYQNISRVWQSNFWCKSIVDGESKALSVDFKRYTQYYIWSKSESFHYLGLDEHQECDSDKIIARTRVILGR